MHQCHVNHRVNLSHWSSKVQLSKSSPWLDFCSVKLMMVIKPLPISTYTLAIVEICNRCITGKLSTFLSKSVPKIKTCPTEI
jgi:hypothetical protein